MLKTLGYVVGCLLVAATASAQTPLPTTGPAAEPATLVLLGAGLLGLGEATRRRLRSRRRVRATSQSLRTPRKVRSVPVGRSQ